MAKVTAFGATTVGKIQIGNITYVLTTDGRLLKSICGDKPTVVTRGLPPKPEILEQLKKPR